MPKSPLPQSCPQAIPLYEGKKIDLYKAGEREFVVHPGAVVILPLLSESEVILIKNERFVVDQILWELPAGTLEPEETPLFTAHREIIEEIGYEAKSITPLFDFFTTPGFCNERIYAFVATDLHFVGQNLNPDEKISPQILSWDKIFKMIKEGAIHDAKTIATLLFYHQFLISVKF